jgi:hypothetical protein
MVGADRQLARPTEWQLFCRGLRRKCRASLHQRTCPAAGRDVQRVGHHRLARRLSILRKVFWGYDEPHDDEYQCTLSRNTHRPGTAVPGLAHKHRDRLTDPLRTDAPWRDLRPGRRLQYSATAAPNQSPLRCWMDYCNSRYSVPRIKRMVVDEHLEDLQGPSCRWPIHRPRTQNLETVNYVTPAPLQARYDNKVGYRTDGLARHAIPIG